MSARVCSPPSSIMDITRDIQGCPTPGNPTSGSLPVSSATQSSSPSNSILFGSSTGASGHTGGITTFKSGINKNVARSLFGPHDPRSGQYAREKVRQIKERDMQKWNFNFETEQPLEGRFKWEPLSTTTTTGSPNTEAQVPYAYAFSRMPYIFSQSATSTVTSTERTCERNFENRDPLLIVRTAEAANVSSLSTYVHVASTTTCPPPTPVKSCAENRAISPDRVEQHSQVSTSNSSFSSSSFSSQPLPESSSDVIISSIPSPPSSLEEDSSPSSSTEDINKSSTQEESSLGEKSLVSTTLIRPRQTKISDFMVCKKRPAQTQTSSCPSSEKKPAL